MLTKLVLLILRGYKRWISPMLPPACRFTPTCSEYAMQAIERFGLWRGGWLALRRLLRCHPFHPGGYDPVPDQFPSRRAARIFVPLMLLLLIASLGMAADRWSEASVPELLIPPPATQQAAAELTRLQDALTNQQPKDEQRLARWKLREGMLLAAVQRNEEAIQALEEAIRAYERWLHQHRREGLPPAEFKSLAVTAAYLRAQLLAAQYGANSSTAIKALEWMERLLKADEGMGTYGPPQRDVPLWVWDEKAKTVRRYESAYAVLSRELDALYRTGWNYRLFDALVRLCGGDPRYSYGLAVILLALLLRVAMHPFNRKAMRSMWKMQELQPLFADLQERYRDDPKKLQAEMMRLYREHGIRPLGGCLPLLLQFPILIWVYYGVLHYRFQFAHARFLWIQNLIQPDYPLFALYLASFVASSFFMQTPTQDPQQRQQQIFMNLMMTGIFALFFHNFPSAFILYWFASQLFYFAEMFLLKRRFHRERMPVREVVPDGTETKKRPKVKAQKKA